jgi:hypothetical protein|tara:strand:- start:398 stop:592 length:195 start_codon:yes stop_codon:yes gene_type:complete
MCWQSVWHLGKIRRVPKELQCFEGPTRRRLLRGEDFVVATLNRLLTVTSAIYELAACNLNLAGG